MRGNAISKRDAVILRELATNARTPITRIAKILSISDVAVKRRIVKLEESGIIKKYTIVPNNKKLGYDIVALIGVNTNPDKVLDVLQSLKDKDNVTYMALTSGDHDL
ncbi:MAG: Lrp/AsnC family transcriptional regulator, partial [Zestosphaera sp.]